MTMTLTGSTGLFTRLAAVINSVKAQQSLQTDINLNGVTTPSSGLATVAANILNAMALADSISNPGQVPLVTAGSSTATSLQLLINQMTENDDYIAQPTVSISTTAGSNTGTWKLVTSVTDKNGYQMDYVIPESLTVNCPAGYYNTSGASVTLGSEPLTISGQSPTSTDPLDASSPSYSGTSVGAIITDPTLSAGTQTGQNILTNSDFQTWTVANIPDGWTGIVGAAGTNYGESSTGNGFYTQDGDTQTLELISADGSTATAIVQPFGTGTGGNGITLGYGTPYVVAFQAKVSSTSGLSAGVLKVDLIDSASGSPNVVTDNNGNANSVTISYSTLTTSYQQVSAFFRLPTSLTSYTLPLRLRVSTPTAFTTAKNVFVAGLSMAQPVQLYAGGPYVSAIRGQTDAVTGDSYKITVSNNNASNAKIGLYMSQLFGLKTLGLLIPSGTGSPATIPESLITD